MVPERRGCKSGEKLNGPRVALESSPETASDEVYHSSKAKESEEAVTRRRRVLPRKKSLLYLVVEIFRFTVFSGHGKR